jgi:hypothetical protein
VFNIVFGSRRNHIASDDVITVVSETLTLSSTVKPAAVNPQISRVATAAPIVPPITFVVGAPVSVLDDAIVPP